MPSDHLLDNATWHALTTRLAHAAERQGTAARFHHDAGIFCAVERWDATGWADLAGLVGPAGIAVFLQGEVPSTPDGWTELDRGPGLQMILRGAPGDAPIDAEVAIRPLDADDPVDVDAAVELVALTEPGPFRRGTLRLGGYLGAFRGDRLVAMAGERMQLPGWTEVSAVCTHPDWRGRGLAAALTAQVALGIQRRGDQVLLHVAADNLDAERVYRRLGFELRRGIVWCATRAPGDPARSAAEGSREDLALHVPHGQVGDGGQAGG